MAKNSFVWGAASSAYQTEGFSTISGGGISIWDTFCHTPGKIAFDDNADVACDGFHRYREDLELLKATGATAYRFSASWARTVPESTSARQTAREINLLTFLIMTNPPDSSLCYQLYSR